MAREAMYGTPLENPRWEAFCQYFVLGNPKHDPNAPKDDPQNPPDTRHNATRSYIQAGYKARGPAARTGASRLLTNANIQARIVALREEQERIWKVYLRPWLSFLPEAQRVLEEAMAGEEISPAQLRAAKVAIDQALGPTWLRFAPEKGSGSKGGFNVTLWSGRREDDSVSDALGEGGLKS